VNDRIHIREITEADPVPISRAFAEQGWDKPVAQYLGYCRDSRDGRRVVLVAEYDGRFAGYVTLVWDSAYPPFHEAGIPEIADFNVLWKYRRRGIGAALIDAAERRAGERSAVVGLGVGLTEDYGAAQILYVRRGYVPDGRGLFQRGRYLQYGDQAPVDDDLVLHWVKRM
jgi:GNAT superfamily N-acetyltransferase